MAGSKVHMLVYPYGLCIRLELLSRLCPESLCSEVSSQLRGRKTRLLSFPCHSLTPRAIFQEERSIFHWNCDQLIFFLLLPSEAEVSLCASWSKGQLRMGNSFQQQVGKVLGNFDNSTEGSTDLSEILESPDSSSRWVHKDWAAHGQGTWKPLGR